MPSERNLKIALGSIALIIALSLAFLALAPIPKKILTSENGANIFFEVNRRYVMFPGQCATFSWRVDGIQEIYFMSQETIGEDSKRHCIQGLEQAPYLKIVFQDGNDSFYWLPVPILIRNPLVWLALLTVSGIALYIVLPGQIIRPVLRGVEVTAIWLLLTAVILESGFRLWVLTSGSERERILYLGTPQEIVDANRAYLSLPFVNYGLSPTQSDVNVMGFRGEAVSLQKPEDVFRIVTLGGSTTYGWELAWDEAWPHQLQTVLRDEYGYSNVEIINAGVPGYNILNSLVNFHTRIVELNPDMILVYHATNDSVVMIYENSDCYRGENMQLGFGINGTWELESPNLSWSAFQRFVFIRLGLIPDPTVIDEIPAIRGVPTCGNGEPSDYPMSHYFERNLTHLVTLAQHHEMEVVLSTWAFRYSKEPELTTNLFLPFTLTLNQVIRDVADTTDASLIDLEQVLPTNPDYWLSDEVHQSTAGAHAQAEIYAAYLDDNALIPQP